MHNISVNNGVAEVMTRGSAWHQLGQVVEDAKTAAETMELAGLGWQVGKEKLYDASGTETPAFGVFRQDNRAFLGAVGDQYTPIQNQFQFDFVDTLLEADGNSHYEAAGALGKGERVWVLADINADYEVVPGDVSKTYLAFTNSHDGSSAAKVFLTTVRIVCENTLNMALSNASSMMSVRHTRNAEVRLTEARSLIAGARQTAEGLAEKLRLLAGRKLEGHTYEAIVNRLFYVGRTKEQIEKDKRTENTLVQILERYDANDGNKFPEVRGTAYNFFNAITEYTDHYRPVRQTSAKAGYSVEDIRAENALFGGGSDFKNKALDIILAATEGAPRIDRAFVTVPSTFSDSRLLETILSNN